MCKFTYVDALTSILSTPLKVSTVVTMILERGSNWRRLERIWVINGVGSRMHRASYLREKMLICHV